VHASAPAAIDERTALGGKERSVSWISEGLDLGNIAETSEEEVTANLMHVWSWRGATYEFAVKSLMLDHAADPHR
jgi:hypothetical protein